MTVEYIEREAAVDALNKALFFYEDETEARFKNDPDLDISEWFFHRIFVQHMNEKDRQTVLDIPAADVAPVVRGRWVHGEFGPYCSNCDSYPPTRKRYGNPGDTEFDYTTFCPRCGAKMEYDV